MYTKYTEDSKKALNRYPIYRLFGNAEARGNVYYCPCPNCGAQGKKKSKQQGLHIYYDVVRNINRAHCYQCDFKLSGAINAYAYLNRLDPSSEFIKVLEGLSSESGIPLQKEEKTTPRRPKTREDRSSFVSRQLKESGLTFDDVLATVYDGDDIIRISPFQKGSLDVSNGNINLSDDEMLILYYDLEGRRKTYLPEGAKTKERPYTRVRWSNPAAHESKIDGKPIKYQSPTGSKIEFYIPQKIRDYYKNATPIDTLFLQEGEKKAEKACKHGIPSIAIQGIQAVGNKVTGLPPELQYLVQKCSVKNIVLLFDSDWQDLSKDLKEDSIVDTRPKQFAAAAIKFKKYVKTLNLSKIYVDIWFGHVNENEARDKGIDDLLCNTLSGRESELKEDIFNTMLAHDGIGTYVSIHNISSVSEHQIQNFWNLNSKEDFFNIHRERLLKLPSFRFGGVFYRVDDDKIIPAREIGSGQDFWEVYYEKEDKKIKISVIDALDFLNSNGFRSFTDEEKNNAFARIDSGVIYPIRHYDIQSFVFNYVKKATKDRDVHEYFANSLDSKLSASKLNLLDKLHTTAGDPERDRQRFFYNNVEISITADEIKADPLVGPVWEQNLIDRHFKRIPVIEDITMDDTGNFDITLSSAGEECEFLRYLMNTSTFRPEDFNGEESSAELNTKHLINKITSIGYLLRDYRSETEAKAVIAMDARMSEVGDSNGRSGKSLIGMAISNMLSQVFISGRKIAITDQFLFSEVSENTKNIFYDDIGINADLGNIYPEISGNMTVNVKQGGRFTIPFRKVPKIFITTNHAINSEGASTDARIINMAFSPWYNKNWTPLSEFGHNFFSEWDDRQWILFDNLMAECVRFYMKSIECGWADPGCGAVQPPMQHLFLRNKRQEMGEAFFQWAEVYFSEQSDHLHTRLFRKNLYDDFNREYPGNAKFVSASRFRRKLIAFCEFKGLHFNGHREHRDDNISFAEWSKIHPGETFVGKEEKTLGREYFTVSRTSDLTSGNPIPATPISNT